MNDNQLVVRIAQKIRAFRTRNNMTVQELARRTNISKGLLSKIENCRTVPSLPVFLTLIQSLDLSMKEFFEDMVLINGKNYLIVKKDQYMPLTREGREGFHYHHILSHNVPSCTFEATVMTVAPGATGNPTTSDGYEFKYMLSGQCEYHINNEIVILEEGDSLYFDGSCPHLPVNRSSEKVVMLVAYFLLNR